MQMGLGCLVLGQTTAYLGPLCTVYAPPDAPIRHCEQREVCLHGTEGTWQLCCALYISTFYLIHLVHVSTLRYDSCPRKQIAGWMDTATGSSLVNGLSGIDCCQNQRACSGARLYPNF